MATRYLAVTATPTVSVPSDTHDWLIDCDFEGWTADSDLNGASDAWRAANYCFREYEESLQTHWGTHINTTHVVSGSCSGIAPYTGTKHFHVQHYSGLGVGDDPCLGDSDDPGSVNSHTVILPDFLSRLNGGSSPTMLFLHFYITTNAEFGTLCGGHNCKLVQFDGNGSQDHDAWMHWSSDGGIHMTNSTGLEVEENIPWGPKIAWPGGNPHGDGNWHSIAMSCDLTTGIQNIWLDTTDWANPTETRTYTFGDTTAWNYITIVENFSANYPSASCWHKLGLVRVATSIPS